MAISASQVKELREATGVGMMECKKALEDAGGDYKKALTFLREKGLAKAASKSGRTAAEGAVEFVISSDRKEAAVVELNCETDFAGRNQAFRAFANRLAQLTLKKKQNSVDAVKDANFEEGGDVSSGLVQLIATIGENINLRRVAYLKAEQGFISGYNHMQGKIGTLVIFEGQRDEAAETVGSDLAMQVAASAPRFFDRSEITGPELEEEKRVLRKQIEEQGKPAQVVEKILVGQLNKFFSESCFLDQPFVKEPKISVTQYIKDSGIKAKPVKFVRFQLGEGINVSKTDFQQEVNNLVK